MKTTRGKPPFPARRLIGGDDCPTLPRSPGRRGRPLVFLWRDSLHPPESFRHLHDGPFQRREDRQHPQRPSVQPEVRAQDKGQRLLVGGDVEPSKKQNKR